jgi:hypothetical protein
MLEIFHKITLQIYFPVSVVSLGAIRPYLCFYFNKA